MLLSRNLLCLPGVFFCCFSYAVAQDEPFSKRVVASGFQSAWEVVYGPSDSLWITENRGYRIQRVDISSGVKTLLLDLKATDGSTDLPLTGGQAQGGLMGLALHPALYSTDASVRAASPWVYAAYVYKRGSCPGTNTACIFTTKIVRYTYSGNTLTSPVIVLDNIPGSSDHNSGRLVMSPVVEPGSDAAHTQYRLYYTVGDMGAGRELNSTRTENAQNIDVLEGKVLRINTQQDGDAGVDAWVPNDNPYYNNAVISPQDYVFSYGHRNAQGLAWGKVGSDYILYSSEQMDKTDDEVNIIKAGRNYGWDQVAGYCDGNVNGLKIGQNTSANEQAFCNNPANANNTAPIFTLFTGSAALVATLPDNDNTLWPTVAPSSIDFYGMNRIPGWNYSLLVTPLKKDFIYRLLLSASGDAISGDTISYFRGDGNRIRRVTAAPDGITFYVARDAGATQNGGTVMEYIYSGSVLALNDDPRVVPPSSSGEIAFYPNPAVSTIRVRGNKNTRKPWRAEVYDRSGYLMKVVSSTAYDFTIDISTLPPGIYILKLRDGYDLVLKTQKMIKAY